MFHNPPQSVIAVFERLPYWGPEAQRQFEEAAVAIKECRSLDDLIPSITGFGSALIVLDLQPALPECLAWLSRNAELYWHRCPIIACGNKQTDELEWNLREAGVTAYLPDVIAGDDFGRLCRRLLGQPR